jgi:hypothetical protein
MLIVGKVSILDCNVALSLSRALPSSFRPFPSLPEPQNLDDESYRDNSIMPTKWDERCTHIDDLGVVRLEKLSNQAGVLHEFAKQHLLTLQDESLVTGERHSKM